MGPRNTTAGIARALLPLPGSTLITLLVVPVLIGSAPAHGAEGPWRMGDALGVGNGFSLGLHHRTRFENLSNDVQPGVSPNDQLIAMRTVLDARYDGERTSVQLELADMRQMLSDKGSALTNLTVNTRDVLQASVGYRFGERRNSWVRFGRFTDSWGSGRLLERPNYANAPTPHDGFVVHHSGATGNEFRLLATRPVRKLPTDQPSLLDNEYEADESSDALRFYGAHVTLPNLFSGLETEWYFFALREKDTGDRQTRNRNLDTAGFRLRKLPSPGNADFEVEMIAQLGEQRASAAATDIVDLDHRAFYYHLGAGYTFDVPYNLRLLFEFDHASGDEDPFDQDSGRFDSLFGPTTAQFGAVGLYRPFSRTNLITPGLRLVADLTPEVNMLVSYRHFWLAEERDSWGRTGLRDIDGDSGRYLGQQLEFRVGWQVIPGNFTIVAGAIFLDAHSLSDENSAYFHLATVLTF